MEKKANVMFKKYLYKNQANYVKIRKSYKKPEEYIICKFNMKYINPCQIK